MAENRTITMNIDALTLTEIVQTTGHDKLQQALGYLIQWNLSFPRVSLFANVRDGIEIVACYTKPDSDERYVIGAIWHDDHFGFHS